MKTVAVYSGGLDSTAMLSLLLHDGHDVSALSFDYGQRHACELQAAKRVTDLLGIKHTIVDVRGLAALLPGSSQTDSRVTVPHGHYEEQSMRSTVVPNRNMVMLSMAAAHALAIKADAIAYAAHGGDHAIYPDCRAEFVEAMRAAFAQCDWNSVNLLAPFIHMTKGEVTALGLRLGAPLELTWSCYQGGADVETAAHCGKCGTCTERREAFALAGAVDMTRYAG